MNRRTADPRTAGSDPTLTGFSAELEALVRQHAGNLTGAHPAAEVHEDLLDAYIDSAVVEQQELVNARTMRHDQMLRLQLAGLTAERELAERARAEAQQQVAGLAAQVMSTRRSLAGPDPAIASPAPGIPVGGARVTIDSARMRTFTASRAALLERQRNAAAGSRFLRSAARLRLRRDTWARRAAATGAKLADRQARHEAALADLDEAMARFRGQGATTTDRSSHAAA